MPLYNGAVPLEKSIFHLEAQISKNLDYSFVDDGNRDESGRLCDSIAEQDDRVSAS